MEESSAEKLAILEEKKRKAAEALNGIDAEIAELRAATRGSVLEAMKKTVAEYGFTAAELFGTTPAAKPKGKVKTTKRGPAVVKYQDEVGNTWGGGKGPRPAWVKAIQGAGGDIEKYLVVDAQKAAAQRLAAVGGEAPDMADIPRRKGTE